MAQGSPRWELTFPRKVLLVVIIAALAPLLLVYALVYLIWSGLLYVLIWLGWSLRGKRVLVVYSDSPVWKAYFEEQVLPPLADISVVLNWSQRRRWGLSLAVIVFRHFAGEHDFNPAAFVFRPLRLAQRFRFYEAFRDYKHGRAAPVERLRRELLEAAGRQ